jgi:NAD(P)H-flavin reductase/hemoglobin-like flavoprotein
MSPNPRIIKETFTHVESAADDAIEYFFSRLFAADPRLRTLFPASMATHRDRFFGALTRIVWSLDSPADLAAYLGRLGRDHRKFGVTADQFSAVGTALVATVRRFAADAWDEQVETAWTQAFAEVARLMIEAADADAASGAPPWWVAEVIDHELRTPDIAVLTLRPAQPLPYAAGQHVSVQVSRWPRIWRSYSIANAPRGDGTLRLHIRALPAGWVSGALVRHTRIGDTVLLGPARGAMTLDPSSDRDLLCVAGGTGLAPMRALIEQISASAKRRTTRLIVGARTRRELYDLPELRRLEASHPWLRVIPIVSAEPSEPGRDGLVTDALDRLHARAEHSAADRNATDAATAHTATAKTATADTPTDRTASDRSAPDHAAANRAAAAPDTAKHDVTDDDVYVAGPTSMITHTVDRLQRLGVPPAQIHHDLLDADGRTGEERRAASDRRHRAPAVDLTL